MNVAIITARGGSKRIPKKNIKEFCGKPILFYSVEAAVNSGVFDKVMVSTDSQEIADIAVQCGAEVPFLRSENTSNDFATTADVLLEVIFEYEKRGVYFENACCIYPTAPFVTGKKLAEAMRLLVEEEADTIMPVVAYSFPPQRGMCVKDGALKMIHPEFARTRSQDLEPIYHDCGQFYAFRVKSLKENGTLIGVKTVPLIVSELEVQDIDNESDWKIAEMKYRLMEKEIL